MVSNPGGSSPHREATDQPPVRRQPLKRRSLSQFYYNKSQSFNCMQDLLREAAFSSSTVLLAKRSQSQNQQQHGSSCTCISESNSECTSPRMPMPLPMAQQHSPFGNCCMQRVSWDGSHSRSLSPQPSSCCLLSSLSAASEHQQQLQIPQQEVWQQARSMPVRPTWRVPMDSDADDAGSSTTANCGTGCCSSPGSITTESLCAALQTASLSSPPGLLGMSSFALGFPGVTPHHKMVMVCAEGLH